MLLAGDGLAAVYFNNMDLTGTSVARTDPQVDFNWGKGSPTAGIGVNKFSVRWTGQVVAPATGTYRFYVLTDDGVRLWVNGQLLVDNWRNQSATERSGQIALQTGQRYDIRMEYYENTGTATAQLRWSGPGLAKQIIPQAQLYATKLPSITLRASAAPNVPEVTLQWNDPLGDETGYVVERSTDGASFKAIATLPANTTAYSDARGLSPATTYWYRVTASGSSQPVASMPGQVTTTAYSVLDGTLFANKPDLSAEGIGSVYIAYAGAFSNTGSSMYDQPDEAATRNSARQALASGATTYIIDIEHWPIDIRYNSQANVQATISKFSQVIGWVRSEAPSLKVGIFSQLPRPDYPFLVYGNATQRSQLRAANDFLQPLADLVDIIFAEVYAIYPDTAGWVTFATNQLAEARLYGKPVYGFVWDRLLGDWTPATESFMRLQLETVRENADGVVLWGGVDSAGNHLPWSDQGAMELAMHDFASSQNTSPGAAPTNLVVASGGYGAADLTWQDNSGSETGYVIERSLDGVNFDKVGLVGANVTNFRDGTVLAQRYWGILDATASHYAAGAPVQMQYRVRAAGIDGAVSGPSNVAGIAVLRDGTARIKAEFLDGFGGGKVFIGWSQYIDAWAPNTWFLYGNMDFGSGVHQFSANLSVYPANVGRPIEIHVDSPTGPLVGTLIAQDSGGLENWTVQSTAITGLSGVHSVYLVMPTAGTARIDWLQFS